MADIKNIDFTNEKIIDVFFERNAPVNIDLFLNGIKPVKNAYSDKTVSFVEHTPTEKKKVKLTVSGKERLKIDMQTRHDYIERFKNNKHADVELVERLMLNESKRFSINSFFHVGSLSDDYAASRIKAFGNNDFHSYQKTVDTMNEIALNAQSGAILRVWYAHNSLDLCGLMSLLHRLKDIDCTIIELELPDEVYLPSGRLRRNCRYWGQFSPEELCIPISSAKILTERKKNTLLSLWNNLVSENAEYRIYEDGKLKSVDFEYLRRKAIPHFYKNNFSLTQLIGRLLDDEAFKDLCVIAVLSQFIYRLIDVGDLDYLGHRVNIFSEDCWLKSLRTSV